MWPRKAQLRTTFLVLCGFSLTGCQSSAFYGQAARGQLALIAKRQNIEKLVQSEETPGQLRIQLEHVLEFREFANHQLSLPTGGSYSTYVELGREHVLWNVFASPEFSLTPKTWCYPIAGCASYRGYFSEAAAQKQALRLKEAGFDVYVAGIDAYSTLGWFDDSVLSSFVNYAPPDLAALIFHELAHQVLYVKGDTPFNESFATAVGQEGLRRWLDSTGTSYDFEQANRREAHRKDFVALIEGYREKLKALYSQELAIPAMRAKKALLLEALRGDYEQLRQSWGGYAGYDTWFSDPLGNAKLGTVSTYNDLVPGFLDLLKAHDGDLERFYRACQELAKEAPEVRLQKLR